MNTSIAFKVDTSLPIHQARLSSFQRRLVETDHRYKVWISGRKSGKSFAAAKICFFEAAKAPFREIRFFSATRKQAKEIIWRDFKKLATSARWARKINETELYIELKNGSRVSVEGLDDQSADKKRGPGYDFVVLDEFAFIKKESWDLVVNPMLAQKNGSALFISTPAGRGNWAYDFYQNGQDPARKDWISYLTKTSECGTVSDDFIEGARQSMDKLSFEQEYEASFINFSGLCYYAFAREKHLANLGYSENEELNLAFDFNASPGVCAVLQEGLLPNGNLGTKLVDEIWHERNSNTQIICNKFLEKYSNHKGMVYCFGDATGGAEGSAKVQGSDWAIIKRMLGATFGNRLVLKVPKRNPRVRQRINAMNSRLCSSSDMVCMMVDSSCKYAIRDFEGVLVKENGDIEKRKHPELTHVSDAIGYYVAMQFPIEPGQKIHYTNTVL